MKYVLGNIFVLLLAFKGYAQLAVTVNDAHTAKAVEGAHVSLQTKDGNYLFAVTDEFGKASFSTSGTKLEIQHIAYKPQSVGVNNHQEISVFLNPAKGELEEVVVTGSAKPVLASQSVRQIKVIDQQRIQNQVAVNLKDVLSNDLNFRITEDAVLGSQLSLQGLSGAKIKILIDGVPVIGRLNGEIDLNQINLNDIERIEIVEGPMSVQYGTDAVAGTINLITKRKALAKPELSLNSYYESVGRYNIDGSVRFPIGKWYGNLSLGRNYFNGYDADENARSMQWNPKEQYFISGGIQKRFENVLLRYRGEYFSEEIENRGEIGSANATFEPVDSGNWVYPHALDDYYNTYRFNNNLNADYYLDATKKIKAFVAYNHYKRIKKTIDRDLTDGSEELSKAEGSQDTTVFATLSSRLFFQHTLIPEKLSYQTGYDFSHERNVGERIEGGQKYITDAALFVTAEYQPIKHLNIQPGLRYAYNSRFDAPLIASLASRYQLGKNWILRASYGQGFRAPTLKELYFLFVDVNHNILGNDDLKAENSDNYQVGINYLKHYDNSSVDASLTGFFNDISNEIRLVQKVAPNDTNQRGLFTNQNVAHTQTMGGTFSSKLIHNNLETEFGVSVIGMKNEWAFSNEAERCEYADFNFYPQYRFNLSYNFKKIGLRPSLFFNHTGKRTDLQLDTDGNLQFNTFNAYSMADVSVQKQLWEERINITMGLKNLFDITTLQSQVAVSGGAHSTGGAQLMSYGRTYFVRFQMQLK